MKPFESRRQRLLPFSLFVQRMLLALGFAGSILLAALGIGILGYHYVAELPWIDALLNAAMILTGMGPVNTLASPAAKVFAAGYALFSGVIFISIMAVVLAPIFHRLLHKFHIDEDAFDK